jgi:PKD repeat protein
MRKIIVLLFSLIATISPIRSQQCILDFFGNQINADVPTDYQNGIKWVTFFSAAGGTMYVDMADYMGVTEEGQDGWVTLWFDAEIGIDFPVGIGCIPRKYDLNNPDGATYFMKMEANVVVPGLRAISFEAGIGSNELPEIALMEFNRDLAFDVGAGVTISVKSIEIRKSDLIEMLNLVLVPGMTIYNLIDLTVQIATEEDFWECVLRNPFRMCTLQDDPDMFLTQAVYADNLIVGKWGKVYVDVKVNVTDKYKEQVWDDGGILKPEWEWDSWFPVAGPVTLNAGDYYTFSFNVKPTDQEGMFAYWLYQEKLGLWDIIEKVKDPMPMYALLEEPDVIAPFVTDISNTTEKNTNLLINFSEPVSPYTINNQSILITGSLSGLINYNFQLSVLNNQLTVDPVNDFIQGETVQVEVLQYIQDLSGNRLLNKKVKTFTITSGTENTVNVLLITSNTYSPAIGSQAIIEVLVKDQNGLPFASQPIYFSHTGSGSFNKVSPVNSSVNGIASITYTPTDGGSHVITASSANGKTVNLTLNVGGSIWPPTITVNYPNDEICHDECFIAWSASDPDNNAAIYLYYDNNNSGFDGTCINPGNPVYKDVANAYVWNTTTMLNGKYWIYAVIDDGTTQAKDYSPGYIEVKHPQLCTDFSFSSKTTEEEVGDADEIIESGETFEMDISIKNTSTTKTYTIVAGILSTSNTNVTITDNDSFFGDFATGVTNWGDDDFKVEVKAGYTGNVDFDLNLEFKDASGYQYYQIIDIPDIYVSQNVTPGFEVVGIQIVDDGDHCNNDGILQSGENSIQYKLQIRNNGTGNAIDVYCEAQEMPEFDTDANTASYPDIASGTAQWCDIDDHFYLREIPANFSGTYNAQVKVYWADMEFSQLIPFNLQVQTAPRLMYNPKTSDFGIKPLGETAVIPVTLTNYGTSNLIISQIEDLSLNPNNSVTGLTFPATIIPGSSVIAEIRIKRDNPENINGIFRIHSNNHSVGTQDILISGTFYNPVPQGYKKLWESLGTYTPIDYDDCDWVEPADLDNDGLIDIVMYDDIEVYIWEQKSTGSFEFEYKFTYTITGNDPHIRALRVGNCDGDTKKDIVLRYYNEIDDPQTSVIVVLETTGNDQYAPVWSSYVTAGYYETLTVGNCDSDPEDEIITVGSSSGTKVFIYNKSGDNSYVNSWNSGTTISTYCTYVGYTTTGDTDKDGKNELVLIGDNKYIFIWEYNGSYSLLHSDPLVTYSTTPRWGDAAFPLIKDVDNDNLNEIIISGDGSDGWQFVIFNPDTWTIGFRNSLSLYGDMTSPASVDLNSNGIPEMFLGEESPECRLIVYEYDNGAFFETFKYTTEYGDDISNIKAIDLNNDGTFELVLSNYDRFMVWGYEEPPILPDLKIAPNNFTLSSLELTNADPFTITAKIQNIGTSNAFNVPVQFYLTDPANGNSLKSVRIKDLLVLEDTVVTFSAKLSQPGSFDIYVVIDPEGLVEELDETNNSQFVTITVIDNDTSPPEFISHSHVELSGDNDGLIEDDEYIRINWKLADVSGINETFVIFNGVRKEGMSGGEGNYFTIIGNQIPGNYSYEIHASDNDITMLSSQLNDALAVIKHAPKVISVSPAGGSTGNLISSRIEVLFDLSIDASTLNNGNLLLSELVSGTPISPVSLSYSPDIIKVTFEPSQLKYETDYKVRILSGVNGIKDINNNSLESDFIWTFKTTTAPLDADFYITNSELRAETVLYFKDLSSGHPATWFWDFGDSQLSNSQNPEHIYSAAGTYVVRLFVMDSEGKTDSKTINIEISVVSISDKIFNADFRIYPNPAKGNIYVISNTEINSEIQMAIFDNTGKVLLSESIEEFKKDIPCEIDISSLEPGIYFLRLSNKTFYKITKLIVN